MLRQLTFQPKLPPSRVASAEEPTYIRVHMCVCECGMTYECVFYLHEILVSLRFVGEMAGRLAVGLDCLFVRAFGKLSTEHRFICIDICVRVYIAIVCISRYSYVYSYSSTTLHTHTHANIFYAIIIQTTTVNYISTHSRTRTRICTIIATVWQLYVNNEK